MDRLKEILKTMTLPEGRIQDLTENNLRWLNRNIHFHNQSHPDFHEANRLIVDLLLKRDLAKTL